MPDVTSPQKDQQKKNEDTVSKNEKVDIII